MQGPLASFRVSSDGGRSWSEPIKNSTSPSDNLFQESSYHNGKIKFGAPHFVDFGKNGEHSPDGKAYLVGHGASRPDSIQAWILGDAIYIARIAYHRLDDINSIESWEFFTGSEWEIGDIQNAAPIAEWPHHMGVVTMTYIALLRKFVLSVSTPATYPLTMQPFDTYFLESNVITGPFEYITHMNMFGPQAYFVNIPTKFLATNVTQTVNTSSFEFYLSYSANFANPSDPGNPPGSGYHWILQHARFSLSQSFLDELAIFS